MNARKEMTLLVGRCLRGATLSERERERRKRKKTEENSLKYLMHVGLDSEIELLYQDSLRENRIYRNELRYLFFFIYIYKTCARYFLFGLIVCAYGTRVLIRCNGTVKYLDLFLKSFRCKLTKFAVKISRCDKSY